MINWEYECRHRANASEPYEDKHHRFLQKISNLRVPWNLKNATRIADIGTDLSTEVLLKKHLGKGLKGWIEYNFRNKDYLKDKSLYDDFIFIAFDPKKLDYEYFVKEVFPCYIIAFEGYRSAVANSELEMGDWGIIKTRFRGMDMGGRNSVFRINAVNYFDRDLCRRAFSLTPEKIVKCLGNKCEDVRMFGDGVLLVYTYAFLEKEDLAKVDSEVRRMLGIKRPEDLSGN